MAIVYPFTARYFVRFRHSDTALTPTFAYFKRADTLVGVTSPTILEVGGGTYYFDYVFTVSTAPDIVFEIDGGSSIPTEEVRYVSDTISIKDHFIDEPISQVVNDIWDDATNRGAGTKGEFVESIGLPTDASSVASVFGRMLLSREAIMGPSANTLTQVYSRIGAPIGVSISADLQTVDGHITSSTSSTDAAITAARVSIKGAGDRDITQIYTFVSHFDTQIDAMQATLDRSIGMLHENAVLDNCVYDLTTNNLRSARLRIYNSAANAVAAKALGTGTTYDTGKIGQHSIVAEYSGGSMTQYLVVREVPA